MCVYALEKKKVVKGERGERAEGGKSNVLFVFFAIQDQGGKSSQEDIR